MKNDTKSRHFYTSRTDELEPMRVMRLGTAIFASITLMDHDRCRLMRPSTVSRTPTTSRANALVVEWPGK